MKDVIITGAFGGMGRKAAERLASLGYRVFAIDKKCGEPCDGIVPIEADITSEEAVASIVDRVREYTDSVHAIIHFAGIYLLDSLVEIDEEKFRRIFEINVFGAYQINKIFLPLLGKGSRILLTTSVISSVASCTASLTTASVLHSSAVRW